MTPSTWQTVSVIVGLAVSVVTVFLLLKSNTREQARQRALELERAVTDAKAPLLADNVRLSAALAQAQVELQRRDEVHRSERDRMDARITELEDRLYGRGTP